MSNNIEASVIAKPGRNSLKKFCLIGAVTVIAVVCIILIFTRFSISPEEKRAIESCNYLIDHLKDPDSFKLYSDIQLFKTYDYETDELDGDVYMLIDYGAKNGYGGMVRSVAVFDEVGYCGDMDEDNDDVEARLSIERYGHYLLMRVHYSYCKIFGTGKEVEASDKGSYYEIETVSKDRINNALKLD